MEFQLWKFQTILDVFNNGFISLFSLSQDQVYTGDEIDEENEDKVSLELYGLDFGLHSYWLFLFIPLFYVIGATSWNGGTNLIGINNGIEWYIRHSALKQ